MALTRAQLRDIVKADNARRANRVLADLALFPEINDAPDGIDPYLWDRNITGVPSAANRTYRASDDCWNRGMRGRTVGVGAAIEDGVLTIPAASADGTPTMRVTRDGVTTVVPVPRKTRKTRTARTRTVQHTADRASEASRLPAIIAD